MQIVDVVINNKTTFYEKAQKSGSRLQDIDPEDSIQDVIQMLYGNVGGDDLIRDLLKVNISFIYYGTRGDLDVLTYSLNGEMGVLNVGGPYIVDGDFDWLSDEWDQKSREIKKLHDARDSVDIVIYDNDY